MKDAPKEIWAETLNDWVGPGGYWDTSPNADSDPPDVKYIRADIAEAEYKRGLEDAAKIVRREMQSDGAWSQEIVSAILAQIQERDDG